MINLIFATTIWYHRYWYVPRRVTPTPVVTVTPVQPSNFTSQINSYRAQFGLSPITTDSNSCNFAQKRANDLVTDFSHSGFNLNNLLTYYPSYHLAFENIAYGYQDNNIIQAWINSPGHAANMRSNVTYICVGKAIAHNTNYYAMEGYRP